MHDRRAAVSRAEPTSNRTSMQSPPQNAVPGAHVCRLKNDHREKDGRVRASSARGETRIRSSEHSAPSTENRAANAASSARLARCRRRRASRDVQSMTCGVVAGRVPMGPLPPPLFVVDRAGLRQSVDAEPDPRIGWPVCDPSESPSVREHYMLSDRGGDFR